MKVAEIAALVPETEVHALSADAKYLIVVRRSTVARMAQDQLSVKLEEMGISAAFIEVSPLADNPLSIFEVSE